MHITKRDIEAGLLDSIEKRLAQIIFEILTINYGKKINYTYFDQKAICEIQEDSNFSIQDQPFHKICLYQSETPSLYINLDSNESPPKSHIISLNWGTFDITFFDRFDKTLGLPGYTAMQLLPASLAYNEDLQDQLLIKKTLQKFGMNYVGPVTLSEMIFYYRQAKFLELKIRESNLFDLVPDFSITVSIHDTAEEEVANFNKYIQLTIDKPIVDIYKECGILNFSSWLPHEIVTNL